MGMVNKGGEAQIDKLFAVMAKANASDLHLKFGQPPILRIAGALQMLKSDPLTDEQISKLVFDILTDKQKKAFEETGSLDLGHEFNENERVRMNVYRQRGHISVSARRVQSEAPTFASMNLPPDLEKICSYHQGLVLVCGATGCGKSTTLAAIIGKINATRRCHILTIEDPIEFSYKDDKAIVSQREVGLDVPTWADALRYAVREDPDVILVGEMRDPDTFQAGMASSETGHLVMGTLHSNSVSQTVHRILEMFPPERHPMVRQALASNLRAIIVQMLIPAAVEGVQVVPALEILFMGPVARQLITRGEDSKISDLIRGKTDDGSRSMTYSIAELVNQDKVLRKVALQYAPNREQLEMALRGISVDEGRIIG